MDAILICPGERPGVGYLAEPMPLVAIPALGESLAGYWLEFLAGGGVKQVLVLATDRPEMVRRALGDGSRWGVRLRVEPEMTELTPSDVRRKYAQRFSAKAGEAPCPVILLDHFPGRPDCLLFRSYREWFAGLLAWMPRVSCSNRIGLREVQPQVWYGRRARVAPGAQLRAPCWLGDHVRVGPDAVIGPNAVVENRAVIDRAAEVCSSLIGPDTFVGSLTRIDGSIAWGSTLIDWRNGSCTQVPDPFLLCALGQRYLPESGTCSTGPAAWFRYGWSALVNRPLSFWAELQDRFRQR